MHAYTRAVSPLLAACELTHQIRTPIDAALAATQHAAYEQALVAAGCTLHRLAPLPVAPDGVFVEDTAVLLDDVAVITRPGAASRAAETESVAAGLADRFKVRHLAAGRLEGGDVMRVGRKLYVGLSSRTDAAGFAALRDIAEPLGFTLAAVPVRGCLHLKSAISYIGRAGSATLLVNPDWIDMSRFGDVAEFIAVDLAEPGAANALFVGDTLILPADVPRTRAILARHNIAFVTVDVGELRKAEAGVTCMSLIEGR